MERFYIDRCDFCMHRNGMLCKVSHRDCKPGVEPCPYEGDLVPCKYGANDNVRRFLEGLGIKVELQNTSTTEEDIREAKRVLQKSIDDNVREAKRAIYKVTNISDDGVIRLEFVEERPVQKRIIFPEAKPKFLGRLRKLFKR